MSGLARTRSPRRPAARLTIALRGAGGERVDLWRTLNSHGLTALPPMRLEEPSRSLVTGVRLPSGRARMIRIRPATDGRRALVEVFGSPVGPRVADAISRQVRYLLRLD